MAPKPGAAHHFAKLDPEKVVQMREWYAEGGISILELSNEFGVGENTARLAIRGITWKSVPFPVVEDCPSCCGTGKRLKK